MTRDQMLSLFYSAQLDKALPEVAALKGVEQPAEYHAEGDAFIHTCLAVAALAEHADERVVWAVALHDIGKASTTRLIDGRWRALGHDRHSLTMVPPILIRFGAANLVDDVSWLIKHHHFASNWQPQNPCRLTARQRRFCRHPLFELLVEICRADATGSLGQSTKLELLERILSACDQSLEETP